MVKKRFIFLVSLYVACLVSCEDPQSDPSNNEDDCEYLLQEYNYDCLNNVPEGYDPDTCEFAIIGAYPTCEWECRCAQTITEAPHEIEFEEIANESCEQDRKVKYKNCFIDIVGRVKTH